MGDSRAYRCRISIVAEPGSVFLGCSKLLFLQKATQKAYSILREQVFAKAVSLCPFRCGTREYVLS